MLRECFPSYPRWKGKEGKRAELKEVVEGRGEKERDTSITT